MIVIFKSRDDQNRYCNNKTWSKWTVFPLCEPSQWCFPLMFLHHRLFYTHVKIPFIYHYSMSRGNYVVVNIHDKSRQNLILLLKWTELGQFSIFLLATNDVRVPIGLLMNQRLKKVIKLNSVRQRNSRL